MLCDAYQYWRTGLALARATKLRRGWSDLGRGLARDRRAATPL